MTHTVLDRIRVDANLELARVVRAGDWVFAQGGLATSHDGGLSVPPRPGDNGRLMTPAGLSQGRWILNALADSLESVGSSLNDLVRVDQYYDHVHTVPNYHIARREAFDNIVIPPSTSIIVDGLLTPGAVLSVEALAVVGSHAQRELISASGVPMPRATSGFAPILKLGEYVFLAGQVADALDGSGIAPQATMHPEYVWDGSEIIRQTQYVLDNLIKSAEAAGSDRAHLLKAQVYLRSMEDLAQFQLVWAQYFGDEGPALTVAPASGLALRKGLIEINVVAVTKGTSIQRAAQADCLGAPASVSAFDLTLLSGVSVGTSAKEIEVMTRARADRYVRSLAAVETELIIDEVEARLAEQGKTLAQLTRIIQFHTNLSDFRASAEVWYRRLGSAVPLSAVQVARPLISDGSSIVADCWAVA